MSIPKTPMTVAGYAKMKDELARLKQVERPAAVKAIEIARAHGDLSENAEYDAAKNHQGLLEAKIRDLESKIATAQVIDLTTLSGDKVIFGATVSIVDLNAGDKRTITIVGEDEADAAKGLISFSSPLARSLIGKVEGDVVQVKLPAGEKSYEVLEVKFSNA